MLNWNREDAMQGQQIVVVAVTLYIMMQFVPMYIMWVCVYSGYTCLHINIFSIFSPWDHKKNSELKPRINSKSRQADWSQFKFSILIHGTKLEILSCEREYQPIRIIYSPTVNTYSFFNVKKIQLMHFMKMQIRMFYRKQQSSSYSSFRQ